MNISVVVPFRGGCPHREAVWDWVRGSLETSGWEIIEGRCGDGPWRKAVALADGISRASGDRIVMHDADVWCDGLPEAITDPAPIVVPHHLVHRLTQHSADQFMTGHAGPYKLDRPIYLGRPAGGLLVFDRTVWDQTPMDPRFTGWGQEDDSWAQALTVTHGPITRLRHDLYHLWHPPQERMNQVMGSPESKALWRRYETARTPEAIRSLLAEVME